MRDRFLSRQLLGLGLTANATRPLPGGPAAVPAFFSGWLTSELAPQLLSLTAADLAQHSVRRGVRTRSDKLALAAGLGTMAGLGAIIASGQSARYEVEKALLEGLGEDYSQALSRPHAAQDLATPWRQLVNPFRMRHEDVTVKRHLPYASGGHRFHADVYHHRQTPTGAPVLLQVHGGGWVIGNKEQQAIPLMTRMAARGWVCVAVNYPLSPKARWPEHLIALKRAVAWIRSNIGEYGGDPSFIAVTGGSAGGHLAAMLALTADDASLQPGFEDVDTSVQACVPHYGIYDFTAESGQRYARDRLWSLIKPMVMPSGASYPEDFRAASPISRLDGEIPPFFVLHGSNDTLVPVLEARLFVDKLRERSTNPVVYAEMRGAQHAFDLFPSVRSAHVVRGVERFLDWTYATRLNRVADPGSARQPA